jgi:hydroxymethylbilane synthase
LRRTAQIRRLSQEIEILPLRGNVDTRLRKLEGGDYDVIVLAAAGLHRLYAREELERRFEQVYYLPVEVMMPAPGQGALALECRAEPKMLALLAPLQDRALQAATTAERMFMRHLGAGCYLPVAAYGLVEQEARHIFANTEKKAGMLGAVGGTGLALSAGGQGAGPPVEQGSLTLRGLVISLDGRRQIRVKHSIPWKGTSTLVEAERLGAYLAGQAVVQGADEIIRELTLRRE